MKAAEIIPHVQNLLELRRQQQAEPCLNNGGKPVKNRSIKKPKRKPYMGPVLMTFSLPPKQILLDADPDSKE